MSSVRGSLLLNQFKASSTSPSLSTADILPRGMLMPARLAIAARASSSSSSTVMSFSRSQFNESPIA